jgi:hypothetical protein
MSPVARRTSNDMPVGPRHTIGDVTRRSLGLSATSRQATALGIVGLVLLLGFFLPAALYFAGPVGDCFDAACQGRVVVLDDLAANQGRIGLLGFPAAVVALLCIARRSWHAWTVLACLSFAVICVGLVPILAGFWETEPRFLGLAVPLVSPGFTLWIAPSIALAVAGVLGTIAGHRGSS